MSQLSETLMENFFEKLTERTLGKNLRIGDMARRITNYASTHLLGHIVTKEQDAVESALEGRDLQLKKHVRCG